MARGLINNPIRRGFSPSSGDYCIITAAMESRPANTSGDRWIGCSLPPRPGDNTQFEWELCRLVQDKLNRKWVFDKDIDEVASEISNFEYAGFEFVIKPLQVRSDLIQFGCYIPTIPRPTSILSGSIVIKRLSEQRTELEMVNFPGWAAPFIKSLISRIT